MDDSSYDHQRAQLVQSIGHDEEELRQAVHELADAAQARVLLAELLSEPIKESPLPWLMGGFLLGLWLGGRRLRR